MTMNKAQLTEMLSQNEVQLTYTSKETGDTTTFRASLMPSALLPTPTGVRETAEDTILVVNLDKRAWRSLSVGHVNKAVIIG